MEQAFVEKVMAAAAGDAKSAAKKQAQHDALVATIKDSDEGAAADEVETKRKVLVALGAHAPRLASRPEHRPLLRAVFQSRCASRATLGALGDLFCGVVSNNATHVAGALDAVFKSASRGFLGFDGETVVAPGSVDATKLPQYATLLRLLELCPQGVAEVPAAMAANYPYCRADGLKHEAYAKLVLALCEVHGVLEPAGLQLVAERALEIDCLVEPETLAPPEGEKRLASDSGDAFFDVLLDVFESAILKTKQSKFVQFAVFSARGVVARALRQVRAAPDARRRRRGDAPRLGLRRLLPWSDLFGRAGWALATTLADDGRWDRLLFGNALKPLDRADARSAACAAAGGAARVAEADLPDDGTCFQWDGVELANRSYCQPCLNGSYWDEFRDARAASRRAAATAAPVVVEMPYWLSGQLQASAMRILLEEVLGYAVHISLASAGSGSTARVAAACATLVPEFWYSEGIRKPEFEEATKSGAVAKNQGALGQTRLFVTASAADPPYDKLIMDHYRSIKLNPAVVAALPAAGSWGAPDAAACGGAGWTNASCVNGTYAPPNCDHGTCAEAYFVLPSWSESWYEGFLTAEGLNQGSTRERHSQLQRLISRPFSTRLNVTATYVGVSGMADVVEAAHNASRPVLFYWWDPDPLVARVPVLPLAATPFSSACEDRHAGDPALSGANCLMNVDMLKAVAHAATLQADASLATFFAGYGADNDRQKAMMAWRRGGGDLGCVAGEYATSAGETPGIGLTSGVTTCALCPAGTRSVAGASFCALCDFSLGFTSAEGSEVCDSCYPGGMAAEEREFEDAEHEREERASMGADAASMDAAATAELSEAVNDPAADEARRPAEAIRVHVIRICAKLTTKWKLAFVAIQLMVSTMGTMELPPVYNGFLGSLGFFEVDFLEIAGLGCHRRVSFYGTLAMSTLGPWAFLLSVFLLWAPLSYLCCGRRHSPTAATILVLFFTFPMVSVTICRTFLCREFDDGDAYLRADLDLRCGGRTYDFWRAYAACMLFVWPLGAPLFFYLSVWSVRSRVDPLNFKKGAEITASEQVAMVDAACEKRDLDPACFATRMLWMPYEPQFWYFECVDATKRLLLTCASLFIFPGSPTQLAFLILVVMSWTKLYGYFGPFKEDADDVRAECLNSMLTIYLGALVARTSQGPGADGLLMTTILGGLVILVYVTVTDIRRELSALELLRDILRETGRNARAASFKAMDGGRSRVLATGA
ncbi:RNA polymerase I-specific transcription initiation factor [Aureococcus anophagefferens]|nr:RNA polymerase I-specific transcription initiation factor [Aureococcus anophagefferens]